MQYPALVASRSEDMTLFLMSFIEQTPSSWQSLNFIVRASGIVEKVLSLVPVEARGSNEINIFSPDESSWAKDYLFLDVTFLGIELDLSIHDFLTFVATQMFSQNVYITSIVVYTMHLLRKSLRRFFGSRTLARKSLLDPRFLSSV